MKQEPQMLGRKGLYMALCVTLFALVMGALHWLSRGINQDFGVGFSVGLVIGIVLVTIAIGWRRGELD